MHFLTYLELVLDGGGTEEVEALLDLVVHGVELLLAVLQGHGGLVVGGLPLLELAIRQLFGAQHEGPQALRGKFLGDKMKRIRYEYFSRFLWKLSIFLQLLSNSKGTCGGGFTGNRFQGGDPIFGSALHNGRIKIVSKPSGSKNGKIMSFLLSETKKLSKFLTLGAFGSFRTFPFLSPEKKTMDDIARVSPTAIKFQRPVNTKGQMDEKGHKGRQS